ncbi:MAG: hypothetical protein WDM91_18360 [Rhizomicrobium sp.]
MSNAIAGRAAARRLLLAVMAGAACLFSHTADAGDPAVIPQFSASQACPGDGSPEMQYDCKFLDDVGAKALQAPAGSRVYRESWMGPFASPMHDGSIVLIIAPDGTRTLQTPWRRRPYRLRPGELPDFEAALAKSAFSRRTVYNRIEGFCVDGVATALEAVVDGRYRMVLYDYCGGVFDEDVAQALDQLFVFAAGLSGLHYPVNPDHPTYRG